MTARNPFRDDKPEEYVLALWRGTTFLYVAYSYPKLTAIVAALKAGKPYTDPVFGNVDRVKVEDARGLNPLFIFEQGTALPRYDYLKVWPL